jgi:hypothetical protein
MAEIQLVRQSPKALADSDREVVRRVLFGEIDGLGDSGRRQWRRFINGMLAMEPGEIIEIRTHRERLGWYHRKHMALEARVFDAQERFTEFEAFRVWVKIGAGHCDWFPGPRGGIVPVPRSIRYSKLEQNDMQAFHDAAIAFLRTEHAAKTLWPKLPDQQRYAAIESILSGEFDE